MNEHLWTATLLLAPVAAWAAPPAVDICSLLAQPPEHRGRLVRVTGELYSGFEAFHLWGECSGRPSREPLCLQMADAGPLVSISVGPSSNGEVTAIAEVSREDLLLAAARQGLPQAWDALPWTPLRYEAVKPKRNKTWRQFAELTQKQTLGEKSITVVGRFEYVRVPSLIRYQANGTTIPYEAVAGYGHMGTECSSRLVIAEVVSIRDAKRRR